MLSDIYRIKTLTQQHFTPLQPISIHLKWKYLPAKCLFAWLYTLGNETEGEKNPLQIDLIMSLFSLLDFRYVSGSFSKSAEIYHYGQFLAVLNSHINKLGIANTSTSIAIY